MPEPVQIKPGLVRRLDLMVVADSGSVRRGLFGLLGLWTLIGAVSSLAVQHWGIAAMTFAMAVYSGFMWCVLRRSMGRTPVTRRWLEELSNV